MLGGGGQYLKSKVFSCVRRRRKVMLRGPGACFPGIVFEKNSAIRCNLVHFRSHLASITLLLLSFF